MKKSPSILLALIALTILPAAPALRAQSAISTDPAPDKSAPAAMETFQLPSHGALLNALVYVAAGPGPHPVVVLLHGFPGNEKNLDLAQSLRRAGYDVLYFDYRGSWGSPGDFSFTHCLEDTQSAIAYMRDAANAKKLRADPSRIILIGHSMGGFMANMAAAEDPKITAAVMISAASLGGFVADNGATPESQIKSIAADLAAEGMAPLAGCTPESLAQEILANHAKWKFTANAEKLATRPVLVITSDDGLAAGNDAFVTATKSAGSTKIKSQHMTTDQSYSDHRVALQSTILNWLQSL